MCANTTGACRKCWISQLHDEPQQFCRTTDLTLFFHFQTSCKKAVNHCFHHKSVFTDLSLHLFRSKWFAPNIKAKLFLPAKWSHVHGNVGKYKNNIYRRVISLHFLVVFVLFMLVTWNGHEWLTVFSCPHQNTINGIRKDVDLLVKRPIIVWMKCQNECIFKQIHDCVKMAWRYNIEPTTKNYFRAVSFMKNIKNCEMHCLKKHPVWSVFFFFF